MPARDFLNRAGAGVDVRRPELGREQMPAAEHVKRQVAVAIIVAVEEAAFLIAVQRVVRGVEVEDDLLGGRSCASSNRSTNRASIAAGSCAILQYFVGVSRDSSSRFSVDLPATGAEFAPGIELARQHRHQRL